MTLLALKVIRRAEEELRAMAQESLAEGRYTDVSEIARLADGLVQLASTAPVAAALHHGDSEDEANARVSGSAVVQTGDAPPLIKGSQAQRVRRKAFPRFEREEDKLVKIAWSKRDRKEYEHKAPRSVADLLLDHIKGRKGVGVRFVADDVFPMKDLKKREIPSYQAYLALAWLVHEGVITKFGREGYSLKPSSANSARLTELWEALPGRD